MADETEGKAPAASAEREVEAVIIERPMRASTEGWPWLEGREMARAKKGERVRKEVSRRLTHDERLDRLDAMDRVIAPDIDPRRLYQFRKDSPILRPMTDAMAVNIDGFGYDFAYVGPGENPEDDAKKPEAKKELNALKTFFMTCNTVMTFITLRKRLRIDLEMTGSAYMEVIRDKAGEVVGLEHLPATDMRIVRADPDPVEVTANLIGAEGEVVERTTLRRFRRYVQQVGINKVFFKELGDPRPVRFKDGKTVKPKKSEGKKAETEGAPIVPFDEQATEVLHFTLYDPTDPYGCVRWLGAVPELLGSKKAALYNLDFFDRNGIPAFAILVSGGALTTETFQRIKDHIEGRVGKDSLHGVLILQGKADEVGVGQKGTIKIELKVLQNERMADAQFQNYDERNMQKIRMTGRIGSLMFGASEDLNFASAHASRSTAEEQVFQPERNEFDEAINLRLVPEILEGGARFWQFYSKGPMIADVDSYTRALVAFDSMGALTPNIAIAAAKELLGLEQLKTIEAEWANLPFPLVQGLLTMGTLNLGDEFEDVTVEVETVPPDQMPADGSAPPKALPKGERKQIEDQTASAEARAKKSASRVVRFDRLQLQGLSKKMDEILQQIRDGQRRAAS